MAQLILDSHSLAKFAELAQVDAAIVDSLLHITAPSQGISATLGAVQLSPPVRIRSTKAPLDVVVEGLSVEGDRLVLNFRVG